MIPPEMASFRLYRTRVTADHLCIQNPMGSPAGLASLEAKTMQGHCLHIDPQVMSPRVNLLAQGDCLQEIAPAFFSTSKPLEEE